MVHVRVLESPGLKLPFDRIFAGQKFCNCEFLFPVLIRVLDKSGRLKEKHLSNPLITDNIMNSTFLQDGNFTGN